MTDVVMTTKYILFRLIADTGKTQTYSVDSRSQGLPLGVIKWYGAWRQYTLMPEPETIWNNECLRNVIDFLDGLMRERRDAAAATNGSAKAR